MRLEVADDRAAERGERAGRVFEHADDRAAMPESRKYPCGVPKLGAHLAKSAICSLDAIFGTSQDFVRHVATP